MYFRLWKETLKRKSNSAAVGIQVNGQWGRDIEDGTKTCSLQLQHRTWGKNVPLRYVLVSDIVRKNGLELSPIEVQTYGGILESCCPSFSSSAFEVDDSLWKLTGEGDTRYNRFISPPVQCCLTCDAGLAVQNAPSNAIVFKGTGPFPATKITLECHNCNTKYGIGYFSNESGKHLYPEKFQSHLVEASTVTYMDKNLYKWIPSLA